MYNVRDVILAFVVVAMATFQPDALGLICNMPALVSISSIIGGMAFGSMLMLVYFSEEPKPQK
jgi:hypothetical protein